MLLKGNTEQASQVPESMQAGAQRLNLNTMGCQLRMVQGVMRLSSYVMLVCKTHLSLAHGWALISY